MLKKFLFTSTLLALVLAFPREIPDMVTSYSDDTTASPTVDFTKFYTEEATAEIVDFTTSYTEQTTAEPKDLTTAFTEDSTLEVTEDPVTSLRGKYKTGFEESSTSGSGDLWSDYTESSTVPNDAYSTGTAIESSTSLNGEPVTKGAQGSSNSQDNMEIED